MCGNCVKISYQSYQTHLRLKDHSRSFGSLATENMFQNPSVFVNLRDKKYTNEMTNLRVFQISEHNKYATGVEASKAESVTPG